MVSCNLTYGPQANKNKTRLVTDFLPKHRFLSDLDGLVMYHLKVNSCCHICSLQLFSWLHRQLTWLFWSTFWLLGYVLLFSLLWLVLWSLFCLLHWQITAKEVLLIYFDACYFLLFSPFWAFCLLQCEITAKEVGSATFKSADDTWHSLSRVIKD